MSTALCNELLTEFQEEAATTRKLLARVPFEKFDYKPHEKSMSLGQLASHVADNPNWATMTIQTATCDFPADYKPYQAASQEELLETFDRGSKEASDAFAGTDDEELAKTWTMLFGGNPVLSMRRSIFLRKFVLNHMIHHRGQLSVYLRMNEIPVPAIYGPSADEQQ
jgi:uncharacterized damage-inducible protein DinB